MPRLHIPNKTTTDSSFKTARHSGRKAATDSNPKLAIDSDMITPVFNDCFWKWQIDANDPFLPVAILKSGQSAKARFCELQGYKAVIDDITQSAAEQTVMFVIE